MDKKLRQLLKDFGYRLEGKTIIRSGIRGFCSDQVVLRNCRGPVDAAEWLCPIVRDSKFTSRLVKIMGN